MEKKRDWEKEIDWYGLSCHCLRNFGILTLGFFVFWLIKVPEFTFTELLRWGVHIILAIIMFISGAIMEVLHLESRNDDYYKSPIVGYAWAALLVILFIYAFFIM